jgi:hypothetical protein
MIGLTGQEGSPSPRPDGRRPSREICAQLTAISSADTPPGRRALPSYEFCEGWQCGWHHVLAKRSAAMSQAIQAESEAVRVLITGPLVLIEAASDVREKVDAFRLEMDGSAIPGRRIGLCSRRRATSPRPRSFGDRGRSPSPKLLWPRMTPSSRAESCRVHARTRAYPMPSRRWLGSALVCIPLHDSHRWSFRAPCPTPRCHEAFMLYVLDMSTDARASVVRRDLSELTMRPRAAVMKRT